jgi:hybrid cluster-associated redox disulfide protein
MNLIDSIKKIFNIRKETSKMTVTKETLIGDILDHDVETARFFFEIGMHCLGCPHSSGESIAEACAVHGTDADELVKKINEYLASK